MTSLPALPDDRPANAPRTYQSAWQHGENDTAVLLTAEDWLTEEADVDDSLGPADSDTDGPSRGGIMRAIAAEIAALRAERTMWADSHTRLTHGAHADTARLDAEPKGTFPGIIDFERECIACDVLRKACEVEIVGHHARFYLTASVGEVGQRIVVALDAATRSTPEGN